MTDDIKQKIAKYKNLGWNKTKIRRNLLLRKPIFDYLEISAKDSLAKETSVPFKELIKQARIIDRSRPKSNVLIDQCPIYPKDLARRAQLILENEYPLSNKKILFVGDDDLTSCVIASVSTPKLLGLIDIDDRILKFLGEIAKKHKKTNIILAKRNNIADIIQGKVKDPFKEILFDAFVTDPPYTETGYNYFLSYGIKHLKLSSRAYIAVPYMNMEEWTNELLFKVEKLLLENGLVIEYSIPGFASYQHDESVISSMVVAKKVSKSLPIDKTVVPSLNKMYTTRYSAKKLDIDY